MNGEKFHLRKEDLDIAWGRLKDTVVRTPLLRSEFRSELYLKAENLQVTGSFKIRAALSQVEALTPELRLRGLVTASSGNFAQGAAFAARKRGIPIKIVMMRSSNPVKIQRVRALGGEVVFCENRFAARVEMVEEIRRREGRTVIHPFDHPDAVRGNATLGREILEQLVDVEQVVVPVSGGGLLAGVAAAVKLFNPAVRVVGVQPRGSNAAVLSFRQGRPLSIENPRTMADGLQAPRPGDLTFSVLRTSVDEMVEVDEESIRRACLQLLFQERLVVEPSGAVPLAAFLEGRLAGVSRTVLVLSGGILSPSLLADFLAAEGERAALPELN